ncbi:hypothetical protein ACFYV7_00390 [Nocardia suismassiliense]|uniref:Secreted protein n=1 Tax=Nocardia suismassiliense TaxID=2077092 RepID=A0ABW6QJ41_9NOCA
MNIRKKMPFVIGVAAALMGSLALAAPNATAEPTDIPCTRDYLNWRSWDGPGTTGREWVCTYDSERGFHWRTT